MTTFLFLRVTLDLSGCPESGDTRRAAHSSVRSDPGAGSSCLRRFARPRYRSDRPTSRCLRTASRVGIDVHGSLERAKDVSSVWRRGLRAFHVECVRLAHADDVPLLVFQRAPPVVGAIACLGTSPMAVVSDRPRSTFFRQPAKVDGAPRSRVPSTVAITGRRGLLLAFPASAPRSRRPHVLPWLGTSVLFRALQARDT
jgi:hypothetical protein